MKPIKGVVMNDGNIITESGIMLQANTTDLCTGDTIQIHFDFEGAKATKVTKQDPDAEINEIDEDPPEYFEYQ